MLYLVVCCYFTAKLWKHHGENYICFFPPNLRVFFGGGVENWDTTNLWQLSRETDEP